MEFIRQSPLAQIWTCSFFAIYRSVYFEVIKSAATIEKRALSMCLKTLWWSSDISQIYHRTFPQTRSLKALEKLLDFSKESCNCKSVKCLDASIRCSNRHRSSWPSDPRRDEAVGEKRNDEVDRGSHDEPLERSIETGLDRKAQREAKW